jgi:uncharacterized integral membrane protein
MNKVLGVLAVATVAVVALALAAANGGNRVTLSLGFVTFYRVPVTVVAFGGLFLGMVVMFVAGVQTDLKVRRVLRERLAEETSQERAWVDRNQQDLFADNLNTDGPHEGEE